MSSSKAAQLLMKLGTKGVISTAKNTSSIRGKLDILKRKKNKTEAEKKEMAKLQKRVDQLNAAEKLKNQLKSAGKSKKKVSLADTSSITGARAKGGEAKMKKKGMKAGGAMMMKRRKMASGGSGEGIDPKAIKSKGQFENLLAKGKLEHIPNAKLVDIALRVGYITADEMMGNAKGGAMMKKKGMARGGMKKKGYAKGGMKKKGYAKGGMKKKGMAKGGAMKKKGMAMGGLKKPAATQTGLKKLPTPVRNKMGYAKNGGSMKKKGMAMGGAMKKKGMARGGMKKKGYAMGGMKTTYRVGGMVKGKKYGSVDNKKKK
tara:strand:+ start:867 stop:1814 length:948 start_codon:yes stop_codon:yes gene_type:complete